jgi:hypothetical protein
MSQSISPQFRQRQALIREAAADFFLLQNRGYPRCAALDWVGNRFQLDRLERESLRRGVFGQSVALARRSKRCLGADWQEEWLVVDGHNVQITVESVISGRPVVMANDGVLRDLAGQSARFRMSEVSEMAMDMVFHFFEAYRPARLLVLFDAPLSHSGLIAERYGQRLRQLGIPGQARAIAVPEREMPLAECVVASSDQALLDSSRAWLDLALRAVSMDGTVIPALDFSIFIERSCKPDVDP